MPAESLSSADRERLDELRATPLGALLRRVLRASHREAKLLDGPADQWRDARDVLDRAQLAVYDHVAALVAETRSPAGAAS